MSLGEVNSLFSIGVLVPIYLVSLSVCIADCKRALCVKICCKYSNFYLLFKFSII